MLKCHVIQNHIAHLHMDVSWLLLLHRTPVHTWNCRNEDGSGGFDMVRKGSFCSQRITFSRNIRNGDNRRGFEHSRIRDRSKACHNDHNHNHHIHSRHSQARHRHQRIVCWNERIVNWKVCLVVSNNGLQIIIHCQDNLVYGNAENRVFEYFWGILIVWLILGFNQFLK